MEMSLGSSSTRETEEPKMMDGKDEDSVSPSRQICQPQSKTVYVIPSMERNIGKFHGNLELDGDVMIDDWIEEMQCILASRSVLEPEKADFVYLHLEGRARDEIKCRPEKVRSDHELMLAVIRDVFGKRCTVTQCQRQFYNRRQKEGENLRDFSYALMKMIQTIKRLYPEQAKEPDRLLKNQFGESVLDPSLGREMRRMCRLNPEMSFLDVRDEAIVWSEEEAVHTPDETTEIRRQSAQPWRTREDVDRLEIMEHEQTSLMKMVIDLKNMILKLPLNFSVSLL